MLGDICGGALTRQSLQGPQQGHPARTPAGDRDLEAAIDKGGGVVGPHDSAVGQRLLQEMSSDKAMTYELTNLSDSIPSSPFTQLYEDFQRVAVMTAEDDVLRVDSPGFAGAQFMLESVLGSNTVSDCTIRRWYNMNGLTESQSLSLRDLQELLQFHEYEMDTHYDVQTDVQDLVEPLDMDSIYDAIQERQESNTLPVVLPSDLMYAEDQEAATMILSLLDTLDLTEIGSLIASERQKYLECERFQEGVLSDASIDLTEWKRKGDEWAYANHYQLMRQYILQKSLNNR